MMYCLTCIALTFGLQIRITSVCKCEQPFIHTPTRSLSGVQVAHSLQLLTTKSWQSTWAQYSHTTRQNKGPKLSSFNLINCVTEFSVSGSGRNCFLLPLIKSSVLTQRILNAKKIQMLVIRVRLTFTSDGCTVLQPLATYITELAFEDGGCRETMSHWILDQSCGNAGAGRHH